MCRIYDGKNGAAGTHGSINFHKVQIIPHEDCVSFLLDTNCGAGWNLLSLLLATKPSQRIRYSSVHLLLDNIVRASISMWTKMAGGAIHGYLQMGSWLN
ncbi:hypothetical protein NC651_033221 [Populus alba x Populus x berolinensis]|nr:hypothetical protein NC651_033221 [Populus alba x Populus x berolinensis]